MSQNVEEIVHSIDSLRPMPGNVSRLLKELENPNASISNLAGLVSLDQALTAQVLQASNSASLGYARTCSTLYDAIMQIGLGRLKSTLLASNVTDMMKRSLAGYKLGDGELWRHSLVAAVASEWLSQALRFPNCEEAYIAGLLHDIGKLFLDQFVVRDYSTIVDYAERYHLHLWQLEEKLIGIDHARVGGLIAEHWNFPLSLVDAIRFHHTPGLALSNQSLPALVNLANYFAGDYQLSSAGLFSFQLNPETLNILKIDGPKIEQLREKLAASGLFPEPSRNGKVQ